MRILTSSPGSFVQESTDWIADAIRTATSDGQPVTVGLSGGSTPKPVYAALAELKDIDWSLVTFFLLDERDVPADHPDSNQRMIKEALREALEKGATLIAPETTLPIEECVREYEKVLARIFTADSKKQKTKNKKQIQSDVLTSQPSNLPTFKSPVAHPQLPASSSQLLILGLGPDGHIASLFPPLPEKAHGPALVTHTTTDRFAVRDRISTTLPVLQSATKRLFLITGAEKAALLETMRSSPIDLGRFPAQALFDERTTWMSGEM